MMNDAWWDGRDEAEGLRAGGVRLGEILPEARFLVCDDITAHGCHDDPRRCGPGDLFVARLTAHGDGHDLVAHALKRGVAGVVAERMVPTFGTPLCLVPDSAWAQARIDQALAGDPAAGLKVIAITGTSGKTTTAWLVASVLAEAGLQVGVLSDLGCLDADSTVPQPADLEQPRVLAAWLARLVASGCTHAVIEVSSTMLANQALAGVTCDTVVVTSIATAHAESHGTTAAYRAIKGRILESLAPDGVLIANTDDHRVAALALARAKASPRRSRATITVGLSSGADVSATPVERSLGGQTFLLRAGGHIAPVAVATPVASFVRNSLAAAAVGLRMGAGLEVIARGLEAAGSVSGRLERISRGQDGQVFIDIPTSGHALASTLGSLRRLTAGRLVLIADEDQARQLGGKRQFALRAARWCDESLVVPAGVLDEGAGSRELAAYARIDRLLSQVGPHDCVLVIGSRPQPAGDPGDPGEPQFPLAGLVDSWLQLAHPPVAPFRGRRVA